jgi:carbamoyl-phosphate synthase large subunit
VPIIGTSPDAIDRAEDRERFQQMIQRSACRQPENRTVRSLEEALVAAESIGYPLVVRPPTCWAAGRWRSSTTSRTARYMRRGGAGLQRAPVLLDRFLDDAIEVDVDAVSDGRQW